VAVVTRRPLTLAGADVALHRRLADGRVEVVYLDRDGQPMRSTRVAHAHELRGIGWHLAAIKAAIAALPLQGTATASPSPSQPAPETRPSAWLHAHHAAAIDD
jgi:hypothetical protein